MNTKSTTAFNLLSSDANVRKLVTVCRGNVAGSQRRSELPSAIQGCLKSGYEADFLFGVVQKCFVEYEDKFGMDGKIVSLFARNGVTPDTRLVYNGFECSMLHAMTHGGSVGALEKYMANNQYSIDSVDQYGRTALGVAAMLGNDSWSKKCLLLLDAGFIPSVTSKAMKETTCADKIVLRLKSADLPEAERTCFRNALGRALARENGWLASGDKPEWLQRQASLVRKTPNQSSGLKQGDKCKLYCSELKAWVPAVIKQSAGGLCIIEYRFDTNEYRTRKLSVNSSCIKAN